MNDINQTLSMLFNGNACPVDESGALKWLLKQAAWLKPNTIWIHDASDAIISVDFESETYDMVSLKRFSEMLDKQSPEQGIKSIRLADISCTLIQLCSDQQGRVLMLVDEYVDASDSNQPKFQALIEASHLMLQYLTMSHTTLVAHRRVRQLQAERLTLQSTYHQVLIDSLAEGARQNEKLEKLVAERSADLKEALLFAEHANDAKSQFLANMSHEIRTPLTAIMGYSELIESSEPDGDVGQWIKVVSRNSEHLLSIVNDILDLSKIESGKVQIENMPISLVETIEYIVQSFKPKADEKELSIDIQYLTDMPSVIFTDPTRMRQILTNLFANAIKFTEKGGVTLRLAIHKQDKKSEMLRIEVADTGIGMSAEQLEKIFSPFTQADVSTTRRFGGTGLGLTISKQLVRRMGGELTVESKLNSGSTFCMTIPNKIPSQITTKSEDIPTPASLMSQTKTHQRGNKPMSLFNTSTGTIRVLLAEDGIDNQRLISLILKASSMEVDVAENGQIAFDKAIEAQDQGKPYHVILMDMQMPVLDGLAATRKLRESGYTRPIVTLTANAMDSDRKLCKEAGCDDFACKPIQREALINTIVQFATRGETPSPTPQETPAPDALKANPLLSEFAGDPDMAELVEDYVMNLPQRVDAMNNAIASEQLEELRTIAHQVKGSAGGYGFMSITEQAAQLEMLLKNEAELDSIRKEVDALVDLCNRASAG
ncbi:MAG TPA: hypothetical protein DCM28_01830 [Phycisphaerales bacterium]|mgnify:CR=1 FL=1|nr:hypothetical protein [Phycisphaerales bacterium]HCD33097.1 hypothetical protein [Phycisphaerales bacterium]|tara:strand:+ start:353 stop:2494 length:2142 start_codon:yes stop_codon:yes gene_type:complete